MLSVTIITLNEERNLRDCLESVRFADEIIVVDSGSRDLTLSIAKEFKARVFQEPWKGFAGQKNSAQDKAQGPWILNIDADERVTEGLRLEIQKVLQEDSQAGFRMPVRIFFAANGSGMAAGIPTTSCVFTEKRPGDSLPGRSMNRWRSKARWGL